ncbi:MAG: hypothetical protein PWR24_750 [Desulfonauticus sp.]|jgi:hypothetical protein|nr:MAG: hypothetical protein XD41_2040 [Desulfonauticus sp. 38_4375]MDK2921193.1 hypothetical protein [Desulfonauticus sp.]
MNIKVIEPDFPPPTSRCYALSMTLHSFKGRKDLEVYLYRSRWSPEEESSYPWENILASANPADKSKEIVLEAFTLEEVKTLLDYLQNRYSSRIKEILAGPLNFPLPSGLIPFRDMPEDENFGKIYLDKAPHYPLSFAVRGFYDLSSASPLIDEK